MLKFFAKVLKNFVRSYFGLDSEQERLKKWDNPQWWLENTHSAIFNFLDFLNWYDDN